MWWCVRCINYDTDRVVSDDAGVFVFGGDAIDERTKPNALDSAGDANALPHNSTVGHCASVSLDDTEGQYPTVAWYW